MWQRGLLKLIDFEGWIHRDCLFLWSSDVFFFKIHRNLMFLGASRCIWNVWFYAHTSEMPSLEPFRCIITLVSVGDTSGLRLLFPSRCTWVQILIKYTSGWANIGHFRCIAQNCQNKIHRNSTIHTNPDVSHLISREYTYTPSKATPAQAGHTIISREYTCIPSQPIPAQAGLASSEYERNQYFPG